jgi:hypothetical protein
MSFLFSAPLVEDLEIYQYLATTKNIPECNVTQELLSSPKNHHMS